MSRRPPPAEQQFGSDSFLDVVANVVGILIILMVLAGMRAARAPVILKGSPSAAETNEPDQAAPPTDDSAETGRAELAALQSQAKELGAVIQNSATPKSE